MKSNFFPIKSRRSRVLTVVTNKITASLIFLAVFLSPVQIPFADIALEQNAGGEVEVVVRNNHTPEVALPEAAHTPETTTTYARGEVLPATVLATPAPLLSNVYPDSVMLSEERALITPPVAVVGQPAVSQSKSRIIRSGNRIAAAQVQNGSSASELAAVTLDGSENIVALVDTHGAKTTATYNAAGAPVTIRRPDGVITTYTYDSDGNVTGIVSEAADSEPDESSVVAKVLHTLAKPLWALANVGNSSDRTAVAIDYENGSLTTISDGKTSTSFEYDEEGLVTTELRQDGSQVDYYYDELGNVVEKVETANDTPATLSLRSLISWTFASVVPVSLSEQALYNDRSQLTKYTIQPESIEEVVPETAVTRGAAPVASGSSTAVEAVTGSTSDKVGLETPPIQTPLSVPVDNTSEATATTTGAPAVVPAVMSWLHEKVTTAAQVVARVFSYTYAEETTAGSIPVQYEATSPVLPQSLYDLSFAYDAQGNVIKTNTTGGITTTYGYNGTTNALENKRVTSGETTLASVSYVTNSAARVIGSGVETYSYTPSAMLLTHGDTTYRYDQRGNREAATFTEGATEYSYEGNRLLRVAYSTGRTTDFDYDERGAVTQVRDSLTGNKAFTYDSAGAVVRISSGSETVNYTYDALGRRASRTSSLSGTLLYSYTGTAVKKVTNDAGEVLREYFYAPTGQLVAVSIQGVLYNVITDRNQSIVGLVNESTGAYASQSYDVWGKVTGSSLPLGFDLGYVGAFSEPSFGYSILGPRVYDPTLGRFLSKDPLPGIIIDGLSQNEYIYAKNDPANQYDPTGHASVLSENSISPKRALVDTRQAIKDVAEQLAPAKATLQALKTAQQAEPNDSALSEAVITATSKVEGILASLTLLREIEASQEQTVYKNEYAVVDPLPEVATTTIPAVAETSATTTSASIATTTPVALPASTTEAQIALPVATSTASELPKAPATVTPSTTENIAPVVDVVPTEAGTSSNTTVSFFRTTTLALGSLISGHILKAEAKKKSKSKAKKSKAKKKVSSKAKKAQEQQAAKVAKEKAQLAAMNTQLQKIAADVAKLKSAAAAKAIASVPTPPPPKMTAVTNIATQNTNAINKISTAAPQPAVVLGPVRPLATAAAGITAPSPGFGSNLSSSLKGVIAGTKEVVSIGLSLVPVVGEAYDGWTIYAQKDPITGEKLTLIGNAFTIVGLATMVGSGKAARELGERSLREIAQKLGVDYGLVNEAAEEVIKEVDLLVLAKKGKGGFDELLKKIGERVSAKTAVFMGKGVVSAATIAKFSDRINPSDIIHILDGVKTSSPNVLAGGHRYGQATRKAKEGLAFGTNHTEFPENWSDVKILESVLKAKSPANLKNLGDAGYHRYEMNIEGINVRTIFDPISNRIVTGYPI